MGRQKSNPLRPSRATGDISMTAHPTLMTNLAAKGGWTERKLRINFPPATCVKLWEFKPLGAR